MKRIKIYQFIFLGIFAMMGVSSCQDFLTLQPTDTKVVRTVDDYRDIMASYLKFIKTPNPNVGSVKEGVVLFGIDQYLFPKFDVSTPFAAYTGEVIVGDNPRYYDIKNSQYNASGVKMQTWSDTEIAGEIWESYYKFVGPLNLIINDIENVEQTSKDTKNFVKGEALVWRAFTYFKLLQYFAPYKNDEYGIPLHLNPYENIGTAMPKRKTQTQVYAQIIRDCEEALSLLEQTPSNAWNYFWREDFIDAMLASIYTYKAMSGAASGDDWQKAEQYADKAIRGRQLTQDENIFKKLFDNSKSAVSEASTFSNDEFYVRIVGGDNRGFFRYMASYYNKLSSPQINPEYLTLFRDEDKRKSFYFKVNKNDKYNLLGEAGSNYDRDGGGVLMPFRLAEMYLIKSEAAFRQGKQAVAEETLQTFKKSRYTSVATFPFSGNLLDEIILERKREFYQENDMIWLDMKRLGIEREHLVNGSIYKLSADDFRYALPIPKREMAKNLNMVQNPGWESIVLD